MFCIFLCIFGVDYGFLWVRTEVLVCKPQFTIVSIILPTVPVPVLHLLEKFFNSRGLQGLIKKLYREFMILGMISFAIFIISSVYHFDAENEW